MRWSNRPLAQVPCQFQITQLADKKWPLAFTTSMQRPLKSGWRGSARKRIGRLLGADSGKLGRRGGTNAASIRVR